MEADETADASSDSLIAVRLLAESEDEVIVRDLERQFVEQVSAFCVVLRSNSKPYWNRPGWFDLSFTLNPGIDAEQSFSGILAKLGEGWERHDSSPEEQWAVWNASPGSRFFSRYVGWASVDRFPKSALQNFD